MAQQSTKFGATGSPWPALGWWLGSLRRNTNWDREMSRYTHVTSKKKRCQKEYLFHSPYKWLHLCHGTLSFYTPEIHKISPNSLYSCSIAFLDRRGVYLPSLTTSDAIQSRSVLWKDSLLDSILHLHLSYKCSYYCFLCIIINLLIFTETYHWDNNLYLL